MEARIIPGGSRQNDSDEFWTDERCFILETWNDPRDPEIALARARVEPGVTTERHRLSVDERYVILEGQGRMEVEGLAPTDVGPGDVVMIPAGKWQRIHNHGTQDLLFYCLCTPRFEPSAYEAGDTPEGISTEDPRS